MPCSTVNIILRQLMHAIVNVAVKRNKMKSTRSLRAHRVNVIVNLHEIKSSPAVTIANDSNHYATTISLDNNIAIKSRNGDPLIAWSYNCNYQSVK